MTYCADPGEQIPCPDVCDYDFEHSHWRCWRCPDGHGWVDSPGGTAWFDLTQPARLLYPAPEKLGQRP